MKVFVFLLLLAVVVNICSGLSCRRCRRRKCLPRSVVKQSCQGGVVMDACECCFVCAKQYNESCGGTWDVLGKCDIGLHCHKDPSYPVTPPLSPPGVCARLDGCLLINGGDNKWISVGHTITRERKCKICVCQSDGTFECTKQEDCDAAGTEEEGDDVKHSTENKSP